MPCVAMFLFAAAAAVAKVADPPDRVTIDSFSDIGPAIACEARSGPDGGLRLRVFRDGRCVLERGIDVSTEQAAVAPDGSVAAVGVTRSAGEGRPLESEVTWVDPWHPGGKWLLRVEKGRALRVVEPLPRRRGIAITTVQEPSLETDFRLLGADGLPVMRISEEEGSTVAVRITDSGRFVALDIAYPARPSLPERAILVLDLDRKTRWAYRWSYGTDEEPTAWSLGDDGILEVRTAQGTVRRFDALGGDVR